MSTMKNGATGLRPVFPPAGRCMWPTAPAAAAKFEFRGPARRCRGEVAAKLFHCRRLIRLYFCAAGWLFKRISIIEESHRGKRMTPRA
jgi:hypothetical protein